jgi:hypothetical protein
VFEACNTWALPDQDRASMSNSELVAVCTFMNRVEAEIAQGALEAAEIASIVSADDAGGTEPGLSIGGVRLLVRAEDAERAGRLVRSK